MKKIRKMLGSVTPSLLAILAGLFAGFIILLVSNQQNALKGILTILRGGWNNGMKGVGQVLYYATPIILTGLSVGFAFKTGMFNIGAAGQLMVGGLVSIYVGISWTFLPGALHWLVALLMGMLAGMLWGAISGALKALLNVNEVISSIMLNYIALYGINFIVKNVPMLYDRAKNLTANVQPTAVLPKAGMDQLFFNLKGKFHDASSVNAGFLIALLCAVLVYVVIEKTTLGFELKACGFNRHASRFAGINEKRAIVTSMAIAGALAGAAGATMYLAPASGMHMHVEEVLAQQGFNGIAVALLGLSNPIGIVLSGLFIAHITVGGFYLQTLKYMKEIIDVIIGLIIYFSAFALLMRSFMQKIIKRRKQVKDRGEGQA